MSRQSVVLRHFTLALAIVLFAVAGHAAAPSASADAAPIQIAQQSAAERTAAKAEADAKSAQAEADRAAKEAAAAAAELSKLDKAAQPLRKAAEAAAAKAAAADKEAKAAAAALAKATKERQAAKRKVDSLRVGAEKREARKELAQAVAAETAAKVALTKAEATAKAAATAAAAAEKAAAAATKSAEAAERAFDKAKTAAKKAADAAKKAAAAAATAAKKAAAAVAEAARCSAPPDRDGCPFVGPGGKAELFSRCMGPGGKLSQQPTAIGNAACDAVLESRELVETLGTRADAMRRKVRANIQATVAKTVADLRPQRLIDRFNAARAVVDEMGADIQALYDDPVCGSEAAMDGIKQFFVDQGENFGNLARAGVEVGAQTAAALAPAARESAEVARVSGKYLHADPDPLGALRGAAEDAVALGGDVKDILDEDVARFKNAVVEAGPQAIGEQSLFKFSRVCFTCAGSLFAVIKAKVTKKAAAGTAASTGAQTGGTSAAAAAIWWAWNQLKAIAGHVSGAWSCTNTVLKSRFWDVYIGQGCELIDSTAQLKNGIEEAVERVKYEFSGQPETKTASNGVEPRDLQDLTGNLQSLRGRVETARDLFNDGVVSAARRFKQDVFADMERNVNHLLDCTDKVEALLAKWTPDEIEQGMQNLIAAAELLADVETSMQRIEALGQAATETAEEEASKAWAALKARADAAHRDLFDASYGGRMDGQRTGAHLAKLTAAPARITAGAKEIKDLAKDSAAIVGTAVSAGKAAFLDAARPDIEAVKAKSAETGTRLDSVSIQPRSREERRARIAQVKATICSWSQITPIRQRIRQRIGLPQ